MRSTRYRMQRVQSFKVDQELTKLRHETGVYEHPNSQVHINGKEYLFGKDKTRRRMEVWERDGRRCVQCGIYVTFEQMHMDHKARNYGEQRWDNLENLQTLCPPPPFGNGCHIGGETAKHA